MGRPGIGRGSAVGRPGGTRGVGWEVGRETAGGLGLVGACRCLIFTHVVDLLPPPTTTTDHEKPLRIDEIVFGASFQLAQVLDSILNSLRKKRYVDYIYIYFYYLYKGLYLYTLLACCRIAY